LEAFSRLLVMPHRKQEGDARRAELYVRIRQIVPPPYSPLRRPPPLQGQPRRVAQPRRIVWAQAASITESESATEVQRPLGLTRFHRVVLLVGRDTRISPVIGEKVELVRASAYREACGFGRILWIWCALPALYRLVRAGKCEILLTPVDSVSLLFGFLAKRLWGVAWVVNGWDHPYGRLAERRDPMASCAMRLRGSWDGWLLRAADLTVLNILPGALRVLRVNPEKCYFAGNGVCARALQQIGHTVATDPRCIGVLANVSRAKAPWFALDALVKVRERLPGVRLRLIGEVEEAFRPELMARIEALGLADAVEITGWKPFREAMALAAACRTLLYCYPGSLRLRWNLVLKIGEYFALGRPVVAVDLPGSRALICPGETGYLVPPDDPAAAADRICQILSDETLWNRLRQGALHAAQIMDWDSVCDDINQRIGALPDV
jgi:glycosyltransferase involved in cell wall biosynthesis